jgi:hypothetical protein
VRLLLHRPQLGRWPARGVPAREAVGFVAAAELAGWRLKPLGGVEVPPCALYKPRLWPSPERLWREEVVAVARSAGK